MVGSIAADERHHQPWGLVHGGLYTTAIETFATTGAYEAVKDQGRMAVGVANVTDFVRPHRSGRLAVVATPIQQGRTPAALAGRDPPAGGSEARRPRAGQIAEHRGPARERLGRAANQDGLLV